MEKNKRWIAPQRERELVEEEVKEEEEEEMKEKQREKKKNFYSNK